MGDGCRNTQSPALSFEQHPQTCNRTSTNLFPELPDTTFDPRHHYTNSSDFFFHPGYLPIPNLLPTFASSDVNQLVSTSGELPNLARYTVTPSSQSESSRTSQTTISSANFLDDSPAPPKKPIPGIEPTCYIEIDRVPSLKCALCSRVFASTSALERHTRDHTRFTCTKGCAKSFTSKKDRSRHEGSVHASQNLQCEICGRKGRKDNMRRHMKTHKDEPTASANMGQGKTPIKLHEERDACG